MKMTQETKEVLEGVINWLLPIAAHSERNAETVEDRERQAKFIRQLTKAKQEITAL